MRTLNFIIALGIISIENKKIKNIIKKPSKQLILKFILLYYELSYLAFGRVCSFIRYNF